MPDCTTFVLPPVNFSKCAPAVRFAQINRIYETRPTTADVLTDWASKTEWLTRLNQTSTVPGTGAAPIRELTVIGELTEPTQTETEISDGRTVKGPRKNVLPFTIDDLSTENIAWARAHQDGTYTKKVWFGFEKLLFGGDEGIDVQINVNIIIGRDKNTVAGINGTLTWEGVQPEAILNPLLT